MSNIIEFFPSKDIPRENQKNALLQIEDAIKNNKKFIIIQAPTGFGKSHIGATLAQFPRNPDARYVNLVDNHELFTKDPINGSDAAPASDVSVLPATAALVLPALVVATSAPVATVVDAMT